MCLIAVSYLSACPRLGGLAGDLFPTYCGWRRCVPVPPSLTGPVRCHTRAAHMPPTRRSHAAPVPMVWPKLPRCGTKLAKRGQLWTSSANFGQIRPSLADIWPDSADLGQFRAEIGRLRHLMAGRGAATSNLKWPGGPTARPHRAPMEPSAPTVPCTAPRPRCTKYIASGRAPAEPSEGALEGPSNSESSPAELMAFENAPQARRHARTLAPRALAAGLPPALRRGPPTAASMRAARGCPQDGQRRIPVGAARA